MGSRDQATRLELAGGGALTRTASTPRQVLAFLAVYLVWGSTYLAIRWALETLPPFLMGGLRFLAAGGAVFAWGLARGDERPTLRQWQHAGVVGAFFFLGGNGSVCWAEVRVPSGLAALLVATMPLWLVVLDWLRPGGSRPERSAVAGLGLGFLGMLVLVPPVGLAGAGAIDPAGAIVLVLGSLSWAVGSIFARQASLPRSLFLASGMEMLTGGVLLVAASAAHGDLGALRLDAVSLRSVAALAYLVVFGSIVAFNAFHYLLETTSPGLVATYAYVNPVVAVLLGWLVGGEPLTARTVAGAAIIVAGVVIVTAGARSVPAAELVEEPPPA